MNIEPAVIETNGLKRRYGKVEAVNGLDLTVRLRHGPESTREP